MYAQPTAVSGVAVTLLPIEITDMFIVAYEVISDILKYHLCSYYFEIMAGLLLDGVNVLTNGHPY